MKFVFTHMGMEIDGNSLDKKPLGGTETALIGVAKALAQFEENEVFVFTNTPQVAVFDGVHFLPLQKLANWNQNEFCDVLISIRQWVPFLFPIRAKYRVYFSPDAYDQPFLHKAFDVQVEVNGEKLILPLFKPEHFFSLVDAFFCVGQWQADTFVSQLKFPKEKFFVTANGVFLENFHPLPLAERKKHLIYSSTPFRGLNHLLRLFPQIQAQVSDAQLEVCSGMGVYGMQSEQDQNTYGHLYQKLQEYQALSHGSILQKDLAKIMCQGRVFVYPNTFAETFCISVLEAQTAGLPVVTSAKAALKERVTHGVDGFLVEGEPGEEKYDQLFVEHTTRLLKDDQLWQKMSAAAQEKAKSYTYGQLAKSWMEFFQEKLKSSLEAKLPQSSDVLNIDSYVTSHPNNPAQNIKFDQKTLHHFLNQFAQLFGYQRFTHNS